MPLADCLNDELDVSLRFVVAQLEIVGELLDPLFLLSLHAFLSDARCDAERRTPRTPEQALRPESLTCLAASAPGITETVA